MGARWEGWGKSKRSPPLENQKNIFWHYMGAFLLLLSPYGFFLLLFFSYGGLFLHVGAFFIFFASPFVEAFFVFLLGAFFRLPPPPSPTTNISVGAKGRSHIFDGEILK